jgi:hypothetical protein
VAIPLSAQRLFSSSTHNFLPGVHTLSTTVPTCGFFQADLVKGGVIANLDDAGNSYAPQGRLITAIGGGSACPAPAPAPAQTQAAPPATPAAATTTPTIVNNNVNNNNNQNTNVVSQQQTQAPAPAAPVSTPAPVAPAVAQTAPAAVAAAPAPAPVTQSAPAQEFTGKSLPNTGPGNLIASFLGISAVSALVYNLVLRRRLA